MSDLPQINPNVSAKEQSLSAIKILEYQVNYLNNQIKIRHRTFDLASIQALWKNKREAIRHLATLHKYIDTL